MAEIDYIHNYSSGSYDNNSLGDELNQGVLNDSSSHAGAREFNYSKKSSSSEKNTTEPASNTSNSSNTGTNGNTNQDLTRNITTGGETSVGATVGTTAAVGGVVIATVIIFTSILGNQFKVVDNSTSLSLYRTEENNINLDYSFDVQYDRSGSVYVKLLSTSHNLTSEEYVLNYEDVDSIVTYEEVENEEEEQEESHVIEQTKDVYTISINGTFNSLIEGNEYTFAITSVIEGVESRIYSQRLYIPSSYVGVVENSVEAYKDGDTINAFYAFALEYETNSEAYVELKHLVDNDKYVVEQTSETYYLNTDNKDQIISEANKYSYFIDGEFINLEEDNEYIISVITTSGGKTNTAYSQKLITHFEEEVHHTFEFLEGPSITFGVESGQVYLSYYAAVNAEFDGNIDVQITDVTAGSNMETDSYTINALESSKTISNTKEVILGHQYLISFNSTILGYTEEIWYDELLADGNFGYVYEENRTFHAHTEFDGPETYHYLDYEFEFMTLCSGEDLTIKAYDMEYNLVGEEVIYPAFTHNGQEGYMPWTVEGTLELSAGGPFDVEIYATYGSERLIDSFRINEQNKYVLVEEPTVAIEPDNGVLKLFYSASIDARFDGYVYAEFHDVTTDSDLPYKEHEITGSNEASATTGFNSVDISDSVEVTPGHSYEVTLTSSIDGYDYLLWTGSATAGEVFGEVIVEESSFAAISYPDDDGVTQHKFTYNVAFTSQLNGSSLLLRLSTPEGTQIGDDVVLVEDFNATTNTADSTLRYEGVINNLPVAGPYKVEVFATYASEQLLYTATIQETEANFYNVNEDNFGYEVYYNEDQHVVSLDIIIEPITVVASGSIYVELVNRDTGELITSSNQIEITAGTADVTSVDTNMTLDDMSINYTVRVRSVIEEDILVFTKDIDTAIPLGEIVNNPAVTSVYSDSNGEMEYILNYSYKSYLEGSVYFTISSGDNVIFTYDVQSNIEYDAEETKNITQYFYPGELIENVTYTITLYGNWGQGDVELDSSTFSIVNYGITADTANAEGDYISTTYTVPIVVTDPQGYLSNFDATLEIDGQTIVGTYDSTTSTFTFDMTDITKGIYGQLIIIAEDSNNNGSNVEFVNIAIWY